ncbi:MAG: lipoyl(octanoyl) transferase LipB [Cellulomonadaceae bacterium]|nr:lipoyl(octanoyl) transferase LipB [Cellulomonadaceae bacterium]
MDDGQRFEIVDVAGLVEYHAGWDMQRQAHAEVAAGHRGPVAFLLEHESVYTAGRRTREAEYPDNGRPVVDVDRGGKITWHGPGQLVAYPIGRLTPPLDVVAYVRALEAAVMDVCGQLGLATIRVTDRSGVWVPVGAGGAAIVGPHRDRERKVCAIGARVAQGVTMHGLALNCNPDLAEFTHIIPCGIDDADPTSLTAELGRDVTITEIRPLLAAALQHHVGPMMETR